MGRRMGRVGGCGPVAGWAGGRVGRQMYESVQGLAEAIGGPQRIESEQKGTVPLQQIKQSRLQRGDPGGNRHAAHPAVGQQLRLPRRRRHHDRGGWPSAKRQVPPWVSCHTRVCWKGGNKVSGGGNGASKEEG